MAVKDLNDVAMIDGQYVDKTEAVVIPARVSEIAVEVKIITRDTAEVVGRNAIRIGQLLNEAKASLPHGAFENWLEANVEYSATTAQRFMKLANVYAGELEAGEDDVAELIASMLPSKALVLAQLASAQRREFVEEHGTDMSVREMQALVKQKEDAERRATEAESVAQAVKAEIVSVQSACDELVGKLADVEAQLAAERTKIIPLSPEERAEIEKAARKAADEAAKAKIEAAKKKAEKELERARAEGAEALKKAQAEQEKAVKAATEQARAEAKAEAERVTATRVAELEEQLRAKAAIASPYRVRFGTYFEAFQADYAHMLAVVEEAEAADPEEGKVLRSSLGQVVDLLKG